MVSRNALRAVAAEEELKSFSYIVCHDLAASLRHLTQFSRLLSRERGDGLSDRERVLGEHMREAGTTCEAMLQQLAAFSRVQQKPLAKVLQDATPIMWQSLLRAADRARAAGAEITVEPLGEVYADGELLAVVFDALIDNAIKFARPDVPARIAIKPAHDETTWRVRISDNGLGVEPAYREAAFQMFRRLHRQAVYPGVGAGLAISRRIARLHGGEAAFLDCAEGACVELALPKPPRSSKKPAKE
jgi:light-regulated signal transduction histidine kinase (bacteriophytochrome)